MKLTYFAAPALALAIFSTSGIVLAQQPYGPPPPPHEGYGQGGWDAPPQEFREVARQGFRDGIVGAERDMQNHRRPNVNNRDEFRHPNVSPDLRHDYRMGFRRGYDSAFQHAANGGYGPPPPRPY
jgi:hypothetical protein